MDYINFTFKAVMRRHRGQESASPPVSKLGVGDDNAHEKVTQENWVSPLVWDRRGREKKKPLKKWGLPVLS